MPDFSNDTPSGKGTISSRNVLAIAIAIAVGSILLLATAVWLVYVGFVAEYPPEPTPVPQTPTPSPPDDTPDSPYTPPPLPIAIDAWQDELVNRVTAFTQDGNHYWRYIPADTYTIGGWSQDEYAQDTTEDDISEYWIAKYPLTVLQYRQFIEAGGYDKEQYWTPHGWEWKQSREITQPSYWDSAKYTLDYQPVVSLSWYEAVAYANWLNTELADDLPAGMCVRLPTEAEWEVACAYGADGERSPYPWGKNEPSHQLADFDMDWWTGDAARIGLHPDGVALSGAQDMAGNVWEYMTNSYTDYPLESTTVISDVAIQEELVPLRGGSWGTSGDRILCSSRGVDKPYEQDVYSGMRLVLSWCGE